MQNEYKYQSDAPPPYTAAASNSAAGSTSENLAGENITPNYHTAETAFAAPSMSDSAIRRKFIMKVYMILSVQLMVTVAFVAIFHFVMPVRLFVVTNMWVYISAICFFIVLYIVLTCCEKVRRSYPGNFVALALFTLAFAYMAGTIASFYDLPAVIMACTMTLGVTILVTLFVIFVKIDITLVVCLLMGFCASILLFCIGVGLGYGFLAPHYGAAYGIQSVYGGLIAIVFALILTIDTWLVINKDGLSEEEYIYAALQLYIDIVYFFLIMLGVSRSN